MLLRWLLMGLGEADGLLWAEPERCCGFWGVMVTELVLVLVMFMEWNETARRQMWTTEPVIYDKVMGEWNKHGQMVETTMEKWNENEQR